MKGNEAEYIIPLRKEVMKVAKYDRTKKAVIAVRSFLQKHTKSQNVLLGKELNKKLQQGGRKNVVSKVHVKVLKDEDKYRAELFGFPIEIPKEESKETAKKPVEKPAPKEEKVEEKAPVKKKAVKKVVKKAAKKTTEAKK